MLNIINLRIGITETGHWSNESDENWFKRKWQMSQSRLTSQKDFEIKNYRSGKKSFLYKVDKNKLSVAVTWIFLI